MAPFDGIFSPIFSPIGIIYPKSSDRIPELQRSYSTASSVSSSGRSGDAVNSSSMLTDPLSRRPRLSRGESMSTGSKGAQNFFGKERALSNSFTCDAAISEEKSPKPEVATKNTDINALLTHIPATNTSWISSLSIGRFSDNKPMSLTVTNRPAARRSRSESIDEAGIHSFVCSPPPPPPHVDGVAAKTF